LFFIKIRVKRLRHGIKPARVKRVTANQPLERQPAPSAYAELLNGFVGILRTSGSEAAGRKSDP
jgi:hypothetical protein